VFRFHCPKYSADHPHKTFRQFGTTPSGVPCWPGRVSPEGEPYPTRLYRLPELREAAYGRAHGLHCRGRKRQ
jgi:hypothetical protein